MTAHFLKYRYRYAAGFIFLLGILIRIVIFSPGLEYDEIWTFQHYSSGSIHKIFTDLATPNNHPLNSLLIKWTALFISAPPFALRLSAFLAGILAVWLTGLLAKRLFRSRAAAVSAMLFTAFNAGMILYSDTGRGYSLQILLILLYALFVIQYAQSRGIRYLPWIALSGILSVLTLPTSVLWLFPVSLMHCVYEVKRYGSAWKNYLPEFLMYLFTGGSILFWLIYHYSALKAGQSFGQSVDSPVFFFRFLFDTLLRCSGCCLLLSALLGLVLSLRLKKNRFVIMSLCLIVLFPLFGALFTKTGPPRVYLVSVPFLAAAAGFGLSELLSKFRLKKHLLPGVLFVSLALSGADYRWNRADWSRADWLERFAVYREFGAENFFCISPTASYPAVWNNSDSLTDYMGRFAAFGKGNSYFLTVDSGAELRGLDLRTESETAFPLPFSSAEKRAADMEFMVYRVAPYEPGMKAEVLLLKIENFRPSEFLRLHRYLAAQPWMEEALLVNSFFVSNVQKMVPGQRLFLILACRIKPDAGNSGPFREFYSQNLRTIGFFTLQKE